MIEDEINSGSDWWPVSEFMTFPEIEDISLKLLQLLYLYSNENRQGAVSLLLENRK